MLTVYSIRLNYELIKYRSGKKLRSPNELSVKENIRLGELIKEKRKWSILGQILFLVSLFVAIKKELVFLTFFMTLYTLTTISVTKLERQIADVLILNK